MTFCQKKLRLYKLSDNSIEWFTSYLKQREQSVFVNGCNSSFMSIKSGVPQGSILGPLLFLIFINDFDLYLKFCSADMYADDTTFHVSGHDITELNRKLNDEALNISKWCNENKMVINTKKTKSMLVATRYKHNHLSDKGESLKITLGNNILEQVKHEKLLGIWLDDQLTWEVQMNKLCKLIGTRISLLRRIKPYIDVPTCKLFYTGYILPFIDYCSLVWGTCSQSNLNRIYKLQKSAARIIMSASYTTSTRDLFDLLGWDTPSQRIYKKRMTLVFKALHDTAPTYIKELLPSVSSIHGRALRSSSSNNLYVEGGKSAIHKKRFSYLAPTEWNHLPNEVKCATSINLFKKRLKTIIL